MARVGISQYSTTPGDNSDVNGINIAEGCPPSSVNNAIRQIMADLATLIGGGIATIGQIWTGTANNAIVTPKSIYDAAAFQTITDAATVTLADTNGLNMTWTLGGNRTLANPASSFMIPGRSGVIEIVQDGTGSRTLTFGSQWKIAGGAPILSTTPGAVDTISYIVRSSTVIRATFVRGYV